MACRVTQRLIKDKTCCLCEQGGAGLGPGGVGAAAQELVPAPGAVREPVGTPWALAPVILEGQDPQRRTVIQASR